MCVLTSRTAGHVYIMVPPKNETQVEGSRVKLKCGAEGYPNNITYQWFKDGVDVSQLSDDVQDRAWIYAGE